MPTITSSVIRLRHITAGANHVISSTLTAKGACKKNILRTRKCPNELSKLASGYEGLNLLKQLLKEGQVRKLCFVFAPGTVKGGHFATITIKKERGEIVSLKDRQVGVDRKNPYQELEVDEEDLFYITQDGCIALVPYFVFIDEPEDISEFIDKLRQLPEISVEELI